MATRRAASDGRDFNGSDAGSLEPSVLTSSENVRQQEGSRELISTSKVSKIEYISMLSKGSSAILQITTLMAVFSGRHQRFAHAWMKGICFSSSSGNLGVEHLEINSGVDIFLSLFTTRVTSLILILYIKKFRFGHW